MKRILVTGAGGSAGYNYIKSLRESKEKIHIVGTDISKHYLCLSIADSNYLVPSCNSPDYIDRMNKIIIDEKIEFLHAQPDPEVAVLSANRDKIKCKMWLPHHETISLCLNKYSMQNYLYKKGFKGIPKAWDIKAGSPVPNVLGGEKLWLRAKRGAGSLAALPVTSPQEATMWIKYWIKRGLAWEDFMISEFLPGREYAFQSVWKDGELITSMARQRIEYLFQNRMPSGQSSTPTIAKTVYNDQVNKVATEAIKIIDPKATGVFCVDIKENADGLPCITEVNAGRFFTTSLFITLAGSNMPYLALKLGCGEQIPTQPQYNAVPKDIYWIRQIDCGYVMIR